MATVQRPVVVDTNILFSDEMIRDTKSEIGCALHKHRTCTVQIACQPSFNTRKRFA